MTSPTTSDELPEEKKIKEPMFDDDNDSVINASPDRETLSQEFETIISVSLLFEQEAQE